MRIKYLLLALALAFVCNVVQVFAGQHYHVQIVNRQESQSTYNYVVPSYTSTNSTGQANCVGANCSAAVQTNKTSTPALVGHYYLTGATLSLRLPDGRIAIVNCNTKLAVGTTSGRRSCRTPIVENIDAEFSGDKAKLSWPVSLDGKKMESETYKIVAILGAP